ncbi:stress response protein nst1-like protein [Emericellopsis cladophorae]|uniref:Stress response protein NST1 n=1 Tax=Emericellopsis cladophorae TaxID=2686198 RepID=A0A9P9XX90_9HYPO|nr:stress response protein nst1-like protein [Emericellopsis cladophorae]KAI6779333.1 stress response protein nst1-like protein [Emericellopsis cladophorae]
MPANHQKTAHQAPASPRNTAKYTNKDGSKFITVPKMAASESSQPSTPTAPRSDDAPLGAPPDVNATAAAPAAPTVNRKKQKRRAKMAAKAAAEQASNGTASPAPAPPATPATQAGPADYYDEAPSDDDDDDDDELEQELTNGDRNHHSSSGKKSKKKKKKGNASVQASISPPPQTLEERASGISRDKIWSTNSQEERERIKQFWLGLGEEDRKSLVKVEKDAVLKKMKEQQRHTCNCHTCGRKRNAIEEELEGLYDAYYLELEQFANRGDGTSMSAIPGDYFRAGLPPPRPPPPARGRIVEHVGDDDDELEEEYEEEDEPYGEEDGLEDDVYSEDETFEDDQHPHHGHHGHHHHHHHGHDHHYYSPHDHRDNTDFLTFGNSLQVKGTALLETFLRRCGNMDIGGILTVADDLLKNDGKRFIEMMEQLAERRMKREEDAELHYSSRAYGGHAPAPAANGASYSAPPHGHAPPPPPPPPHDDEYDDDEEEDEEEYEDSNEEEYEEEEVYSNPSVMPHGKSHTECCCQDPMTEEQRMEEGRRMFQIFAARMFEQRVLSAYKEKVAKERQAKLLEELEEENRKEDEQKARKAKAAAKKKEKAAEKKKQAAEEKARKEAEKAAEEAARFEAEERRIAEQRQRAEEKRKQKEAQKKAEEEARLKKEAERQRKLHEQRERQAEQERKAREAKERERKLKEEQKLKEKEAREQREREAIERKEKQERDKREKEARSAKALKEAQEAKEARGRAKEERAKEEQASKAQAQAQAQAQSQAQAQPQAPARQQSIVLPQHGSNPADYASPKVPVATPVIPNKITAAVRPRTLSQQQQDALGQSASTSHSSQEASPHPESQSSPRPIGPQQRKESGSLTGSYPHTPVQMPPIGMAPPPGLSHHGPPPPGFMMPSAPPGFRPPMPPPGFNGPAGRVFSPVPMPPPGFGPGPADQFAPPPTHHRQGSASFDVPLTPAQPIGRPTPIGRPGSITRSTGEQEKETEHLGSRALLDDEDDLESVPLVPEGNPGSLRTRPPGPQPMGFAGQSPFADQGFNLAHNPWGPSPVSTAGNPFGGPAGLWSSPVVPNAFGMGSPAPMFGHARQPPTGPIALRSMVCQTCRELVSHGQSDAEGFIELPVLLGLIEDRYGKPEYDLAGLLDTEGNASNGGGSFETKRVRGTESVRWVPDDHFARSPRSAGQIGNPLGGMSASVRSQ